VKIKQRPEDFSVKESYRFDPVASGRYRVYLMDKQKLSTLDAVELIRRRFGLKPGAISFCGLKDKQGRTEQLVAVDGADVDLQEPQIRLKFLGRSDAPLSARNTTSNRFAVTVRAVAESDLGRLNLAAAEVARLGVVNYFDSQRFGSLKHGQGFIAKDLIRGDFEAALKNYLAKPSPLDRTDDAKVKGFWSANWGDWTRRVPFPGAQRYERIIHALREAPADFKRAFLQIDSNYRALQLFAYQSYLWNEGVRRLLQLSLGREHLFPMQYQAGTLLFHRDADPETLRFLRETSFPLLAPQTQLAEGKVREAALWALGKDKLTLEQLKIPGAERLLYFKHELRPVLVYPQKLVVGRAARDELNPGFQKINVAFTLPPGSYATLVIRRLFHFSPEEAAPALAPAEPAAAPERRAPPLRAERREERRPLPAEQQLPPPARPAPAEPPQPRGFRAQQREKKRVRHAARSAAKPLKSGRSGSARGRPPRR
jgi:tRNA pseudouridine13 synthase